MPRAAVGRVIGKRGATIKGIERDSGCRVRVVDGDDDGDDAEVRVSHPDEARRAAAEPAVAAPQAAADAADAPGVCERCTVRGCDREQR